MRLSEVGGCITVTTSITTATLPGGSQGTEQPLGYTAEAVECQAFLPKPGAWQPQRCLPGAPLGSGSRSDRERLLGTLKTVVFQPA